MAVVSVGEIMEGTRTGTLDRLWVRTYVRTFHVETNNPRTGAMAVRNATGIPLMGHVYTNGLSPGDPDYEIDYGAYVNSIEAAMTGDTGIEWLVTVNYGAFVPFDTDPSLWPIKVSFGGDRTERVLYYDKDGNPVRNSARDPFDPPITVDDSRSTLTVTRNERVNAFDLSLAEQFRDSINSAEWNGFAAHTVKLGIISTSEPQYDSNNRVYYYTVTYPFTIDRDGWRKVILDAGCNKLDPATNKAVPIMRQGQQVSDPVPLDGSGNENGPTADPFYMIFDAYKETDFSGLGIDLDRRLGV